MACRHALNKHFITVTITTSVMAIKTMTIMTMTIMTLTIMTMTIYIMTNDLSGRKCKGVPDPWGEKEARQSDDGNEEFDDENDEDH